MDEPHELSLAEIRRYMLDNNCKVTNHALVKYFKQFLTNPQTQNEARKQFKSYVNVLATIKVENNQKFLILRKKYFHECPTEESILQASSDNIPLSPGCTSISSENFSSPFRQPPPYKPPPEVTPSPKLATKTTGVTVESESAENYRDCINEFTAAVRLIDSSRDASSGSINDDDGSVSVAMAPAKTIRHQELPSDNNGENKENIARFSFSSDSTTSTATMLSTPSNDADCNDNPISVKEATKKFNRMASEEEAKIISPPGKKKSEKQFIEEKMTPEVTLAHPKAKEWIVSMAKANYQELAKLASEYQELIKLQDPTTGYTALHWAAKHGNEDVVKLIAGTYKADVNARTNGGYTPLHLAMQFGRDNIFELLCNVYKANRDLMDWSGNKPLDYRKQRTSVSASTYSSEYDLFKTPLAHLFVDYSTMFNTIPIGGTMSMSRNKKHSGKNVRRTASLMIKKTERPSSTAIRNASDESSEATAPAIENKTKRKTLQNKSQKEYSSELLSSTTRRKESFLRNTLRAASNGARKKSSADLT